MNVLAIILIGIITLGSFYWQRYILYQDQNNRYSSWPRRLVVPCFVGVIVVLGIFVYGIIALLAGDGHIIGGFWSWIGRVFSAIFFALILLLKTYLSAIVVGFVASSFFYFLIVDGEMHTIPILGALIGLVFPQSPEWVHTLYVSVVTLYGLIASIGDSSNWNWGGLDWDIFHRCWDAIHRWWSD